MSLLDLLKLVVEFFSLWRRAKPDTREEWAGELRYRGKWLFENTPKPKPPFFVGRASGQWWRLRRYDDYSTMLLATGVGGFVWLVIVILLFPMMRTLDNPYLATAGMLGILLSMVSYMIWTTTLIARWFVMIFTRPIVSL